MTPTRDDLGARTGVTAQLPTPCKGDRWEGPPLAKGYAPRVLRVMSDPVEGWLIVRYKGAAPFLVHVNEFHVQFAGYTKRAT